MESHDGDSDRITMGFVGFNIEALPKRVDADYFVPDHGTASDRDLVFSLGLKYAANLGKKEEIACMYASAMSAFAPELEDEFLSTMKYRNIIPHRIFIPSQANTKRIVVNDHEKYSPDEALVLFATCVYVLFKKFEMIDDVEAYNRLVRNSIKSLGRKIGMSNGVLSRLTFPLTLEKVWAVNGVFGDPNKELKAKIIRYLMSASKKEGNLSVVGSFMCEVLAWSGMEDFVSVKKMFHETNSPVLRERYARHEVKAFYRVMEMVDKSEHPQFFRYFCGGLDELFLDRINFPILADVAEIMIMHENRDKKSEQFVPKQKASTSGGSVGKS